MRFIVADVGGTNSRLALADETGVNTTTIRSYRNKTSRSFQDIIADYAAAHAVASVEACCIAVAGPVTSQTARLTNRDWTIDAGHIAGQVSARRVVLVNDLAALGNAVEDLTAVQLLSLRPDLSPATGNRQSLIVGMGTGLNVCAIRHHADQSPTCLSVEYGHCGLPMVLADLLASEFGEQAAVFKTVEDCLSGRGLEQLYSAASGGIQKLGADITATAEQGSDPAAIRVMALYMQMLGILCEQLFFQYLPLEGIYFSGSVARGILGASTPDGLARQGGSQSEILCRFDHVPMQLITDDSAALVGCQKLLTG